MFFFRTRRDLPTANFTNFLQKKIDVLTEKINQLRDINDILTAIFAYSDFGPDADPYKLIQETKAKKGNLALLPKKLEEKIEKKKELALEKIVSG